MLCNRAGTLVMCLLLVCTGTSLTQIVMFMGLLLAAILRGGRPQQKSIEVVQLREKNKRDFRHECCDLAAVVSSRNPSSLFGVVRKTKEIFDISTLHARTAQPHGVNRC